MVAVGTEGNIARGVSSTLAILHDLCGAFVTQEKVAGQPPECLVFDGRRFALGDVSDGVARYFEARVGD